MRRLVVFGRRLSARFPCPAGQEIARNPPLRVASYVVANIFCRHLKHNRLLTIFQFRQFRLDFVFLSVRLVFSDLGSGDLVDFRGATEQTV